MMEKTDFINPYQKEDYIIWQKLYSDKKTHTITLKQLKNMNLSPFLERVLFGRTSEEWEKELRRIK